MKHLGGVCADGRTPPDVEGPAFVDCCCCGRAPVGLPGFAEVGFFPGGEGLADPERLRWWGVDWKSEGGGFVLGSMASRRSCQTNNPAISLNVVTV